MMLTEELLLEFWRKMLVEFSLYFDFVAGLTRTTIDEKLSEKRGSCRPKSSTST